MRDGYITATTVYLWDNDMYDGIYTYFVKPPSRANFFEKRNFLFCLCFPIAQLDVDAPNISALRRFRFMIEFAPVRNDRSKVMCL